MPTRGGAAKAIANSPLVKTAFYGGDANWGRILCAVGYSGAAVEPAQADLWIAAGAESGRAGEKEQGATAPTLPLPPSPLQLVAAGRPLAIRSQPPAPSSPEKEISVRVRLGLGEGQATVWTCDLSHEYVDINGHYRT